MRKLSYFTALTTLNSVGMSIKDVIKLCVL